MSVRIEWAEVGQSSPEVYPPGNDDWVGAHDQGDDYVVAFDTGGDCVALHGSRQQLIDFARELLTEVLTAGAEDVEVEDGVLVCPHEGCRESGRIVEVDGDERHNTVDFNPPEDDLVAAITVDQGSASEYETLYWMCEACKMPVTIPFGWEILWT